MEYHLVLAREAADQVWNIKLGTHVHRDAVATRGTLVWFYGDEHLQVMTVPSNHPNVVKGALWALNEGRA